MPGVPLGPGGGAGGFRAGGCCGEYLDGKQKGRGSACVLGYVSPPPLPSRFLPMCFAEPRLKPARLLVGIDPRFISEKVKGECWERGRLGWGLLRGLDLGRCVCV